jgi:hypothetical protein
LNGIEPNSARRGFDGAIQKEHRGCLGNLLGQFRGPLLPDKNPHPVVGGAILFDPLSKPRPNAIVPAERIPTSENEALGLE